MDREWKQVLAVVGVVAILIIGAFVCVRSYSGLDQPLTVVVSGSMEHSKDSQIGVIDTGDMIIMKDKNKGITTYVDGYYSDYKMFGEYGDVIIYNRDSGNPVIHRAICWIEVNNSVYSAPSLKPESYGKLWKSSNGQNTNFNELTIFLPDWNKNGETSPFKITVDKLGNKSGYLTKGDSVNNPVFDQGGVAGVNGLIQSSSIKAVAGMELPWIGAIKLYINGNSGDIQYNTPFCLTFLILDILAFIVLISLIWEYLDRRRIKEV